jgi:hypothetical protein
VPCRLVVYLVSLPSSVPTIDYSALSAVDHATSQRRSEILFETIDLTAVCDYFRVLTMYARRVVRRREWVGQIDACTVVTIMQAPALPNLAREQPHSPDLLGSMLAAP